MPGEEVSGPWRAISEYMPANCLVFHLWLLPHNLQEGWPDKSIEKVETEEKESQGQDACWEQGESCWLWMPGQLTSSEACLLVFLGISQGCHVTSKTSHAGGHAVFSALLFSASAPPPSAATQASGRHLCCGCPWRDEGTLPGTSPASQGPGFGSYLPSLAHIHLTVSTPSLSPQFWLPLMIPKRTQIRLQCCGNKAR